jgi:hypothetical protein
MGAQELLCARRRLVIVRKVMNTPFYRSRTIISVLTIYYVVYGTVAQFVEPLGWFGGQTILERVGFWGNLVLLVIPAVAIGIYYLVVVRRRLIVEMYLGLESISTGTGRTEAFQQLIQRANKRIVIVGIGMTYIARYARESVKAQAQRVPIDFLMLDPELLKTNPQFTAVLEDFRDALGFAESVENSFDAIKDMCNTWNATQDNGHKMSLKVYRTLPTMSMVLIDPEEPTGEMIVEFFPYHAGEYRPRLHVKRTSQTGNLFDRMKNNYIRLWESAQRIV